MKQLLSNLLLQKPSPTLKRLLSRPMALPPGAILDVPCGFGRNALLLSQLGRSVVCVDNDLKALKSIAELDALLNQPPEPDSSTPQKIIGRLHPVFLDLTVGEWPFPSEIFSMIVTVHFISPPLWQKYLLSLRPGGYLYCETYGGQGMNYIHLPQQGQCRVLLEDWMEIEYYQERSVGPSNQRAVSVKFLGRKRK